MTATEVTSATAVTVDLLETADGGLALVVDADGVRIGATCVPPGTVEVSLSNNLGLAVVAPAGKQTYVAIAAPADEHLAESEVSWLDPVESRVTALGFTAQLFVVPDEAILATAKGPSAEAIVRLVSAARSGGGTGSTGVGVDILGT